MSEEEKFRAYLRNLRQAQEERRQFLQESKRSEIQRKRALIEAVSPRHRK